MPQSNTTAVLDNGVLTVTTDQLPEPALYGTPLGSGNFPNNPNTVDSQDGLYAFTIRAGTNTENPQATTLGAQGVALNGVVLFNPSAGPGPLPGQTVFPAAGFNWNAVFNESVYGVDACGGHAEQNGEYHYRSGSFLVNCWGNDLIQSNVYYSATQHKGNFFRHPDGHSKIVGFCFDGYPIYGPFGYDSVEDRTSGTKKLKSSFRILTTPADGRQYSYQQYTAGSFVQDYEYVNGFGDLDEHNGRFCQTPEYPNGTYAYFLSLDENNLPVYPYIFGPTTKEQRTWPEEGVDSPTGGPVAPLSNTDILRITKTWSEATNFNYDSVVSLPADPSEGEPPLPSQLPVTILLHGSGGNGSNTVNRWRSVLPGDILVAPTGYSNAWNIVDESKAPDIDFLIQLIRNLRQYSNVAGDKFRILGVSNGAALALRAFLELNDAGVTTVVSVVSALHINQWDNFVWYRPPTNESTGSANERYGYTLPITPPTGRNIMTIANTNDGVIPYNGGLGGVAGTTFFDSQFGAYLLATSQGYTGDQLGDPQGVQYSSYSNIYLYKYLNNSVVHVKSNTGHDIDAGHEALIRQYIESDGNSAG